MTIDGRPAPDLEIEFNPVAGGRGSIGGTDANGKYSMQYTLQQAGALTGEHQVIIRGRPGADLDYSVPARYGLSGDQRFEVKPGSNECNIDMVSDAGN